MQYSTDYMRWYFAGMVPTMIYNMGSSILRAMGDSKRPLYFLLLCTGVNTVLDLLCVAVLRLEVAGAAIATSLSQLICAAFVLRSLMRRQDEARQFILHISSCYVLFSSVEVLSSSMRGVGNAVKPAVITFFAVCVLRMALLFTVTFPHLSVLTISICYPATWAASSVLFVLYYKFGKWMPKYPQE